MCPETESLLHFLMFMDLLVHLEIAPSTGKCTGLLEPTRYGIMMVNMVSRFVLLVIIPACSPLSGLIRYKIVIHCFIDGKSRFVTGIHAHNNNQAQTVLDLFLKAVDAHGLPSRVRGDHGTENVLVTACMEECHGLERGS
jgi:hypothetical protein